METNKKQPKLKLIKNEKNFNYWNESVYTRLFNAWFSSGDDR